MPGITTFKPKLFATIGGIRFDDCLRFQSAFDLNGIPSASLQVAVGRNLKTGRPATIESAISQLKQLDPVKVELSVENLETSQGGKRLLFTGTRTIFEGVYVNAGRSRGSTRYSFTLNFQHWLSLLNYSSSLSSVSHPGNPFAFVCPAVFKPPGEDASGAGGTGKGSFIPLVVSTETAPQTKLEDLWGNCIKPIFKRLAEATPVDRGLFAGVANTAALEALAKMPVGAPAVPLEFDAAGADRVTLGRGIADFMNDQTQGSWYHTTLWGKLLDFAGNFSFDVVPRVQDALIVPGTVPLRAGLEFATVTAGAGGDTDFNQIVKQVVRAVIVMTPATWMAYENGAAAVPNQVDISGAAAFFPNPPENAGLVIARQLPKWLANITLDRAGADVTTGATKRPIGGIDEADVGEDAPDVDKPGKVAGSRTVAGKLAQTFYANEVLKHAAGEVTSPLRFDICVGSNIKIDSPPDIGAGDTSHRTFYARVLRVTTVIDSESLLCGVSYSVDQVRVKKDAEDVRYSVDKPALYTQPFRGAPMADDLTP